ncbi:MAG: PHP domain-containing protein [Candidatus Aenigmarchaeota archaeon]|nr:PHP domain-containing protein [Candidatus Aenigmarchaeota archaeon]
MRMELHCHTTHSHGTKVYYDGVNTPEEIVKGAKAKGLDAIVITDHNTMFGANEAVKYAKKYSVLVIKGEEISSAGGDITALGIQEVIRPKLNAEETIDRIHQQGGIAVAVHPFAIKEIGLGEKSSVCDAVEVFNSLSIDRLANRRARKFAERMNLNMVAGSDAHCREMLGNGMTIVKADSEEGALKAIRKGRTEIEARHTPLNVMKALAIRRLSMSYDYTMKYIMQNYWGPKKYISKKMLPLVKRSPGNVDYLFGLMSYISFGGVLFYGLGKNLGR